MRGPQTDYSRSYYVCANVRKIEVIYLDDKSAPHSPLCQHSLNHDKLLLPRRSHNETLNEAQKSSRQSVKETKKRWARTRSSIFPHCFTSSLASGMYVHSWIEIEPSKLNFSPRTACLATFTEMAQLKVSTPHYWAAPTKKKMQPSLSFSCSLAFAFYFLPQHFISFGKGPRFFSPGFNQIYFVGMYLQK